MTYDELMVLKKAYEAALDAYLHPLEYDYTAIYTKYGKVHDAAFKMLGDKL